MKKLIIKIVVLVLVFIGGVAAFSTVMNRETMESTRDMGNPTLPVLSIDYNGNKINRMYGYTQEMQTDYMRDTLIPLTTDRQITLSIQTFGNNVDSFSYEVSTTDGATVTENAKISSLSQDGEYLSATFSLQEPILMNQEYSLRFTLQVGEQEVYYYTRVIQRASLNTDHYIDFVYSFYETCMNRDGASELNTYLESIETVTNNSFTNIDITSTFNQITWGNLKPQIYRKAVASIKEINEATGSIVMDYIISAENDEGQTELYRVTEFYRMRYYQSKIMLLDFHRNAQQIFNPDTQVITTSGVELGITNKEIQYKYNDSANIVGFVQQGVLWSYNSSADKLSQVFSMRNDLEGDIRDDYQSRDIKIIRVEESGDMDFAVYGYMNRDTHEGKVGIALYRYSSERNSLEEEVFIPYNKSFEFLEKDIEKLCYVNRDNILFIYLDGKIYRIDTNDNTSQILLDGVNPDCLVASADHNQAAWMEEMQPNASSSIKIMNFDTEAERVIGAEDGKYKKALGFINEDFIYGIADQANVLIDAVGNTTFAMSELHIEAFDGTVIKDYVPEGSFVSEVDIQEGLIELRRVVAQDGGYVETTTDNIMNNTGESDNTITVKTTNTERRGTIVSLAFSKTITNRNPLVNNSKLRVEEEDQTVDLQIVPAEEDNNYYVYALGELVGIYTRPNEAVAEADQQVGVVLNGNQQYVWERGNTQTENELNNEDIPAVFLTGTMDETTLIEGAGDAATVMNLTGCTLEEVLYQLSSDRAVLARTPDGMVTIVGYDRYNTIWYNQETGEHTYYGMNDSTALFESAGNVFVSYVETPRTGGR